MSRFSDISAIVGIFGHIFGLRSGPPPHVSGSIVAYLLSRCHILLYYQCNAKKVSLSKYPANQNLLLYSRLLSFVNWRSACFPNEGVSSIAHRNCPNEIISPMWLPSVRVERLSKYIEVTGSGYGPYRAEKDGLSCGTMSKCCAYTKKPSVPGAGLRPLGGTMRIMSRI
jgi:hypothetical protein